MAPPRRRRAQSKKKTKLKEKKDYTPFPPAQKPRKVDEVTIETSA